MREEPVDDLVSHLFRTEAGKMASVLNRLLGWSNFQLADDIVQDTLAKAMQVWKFKGIPENPSAWLYTVAKRSAIDVLRRQKLQQDALHELAHVLQSEWTLAPTVSQMFLEGEIEDSQLRMIFACCHHAIPYESQIALTLKTLCGLSVAEIAKAFFTSEETIAKRLYRAREKIREEEIPLEVPVGPALVQRRDAVLHTLYLFFNEGYNSSHPDKLIRQDLCEDAMHLCLLLARNRKVASPEVHALLALMCFQASRDDARVSDHGTIVLLKDQDRSKWNKRLIEKGLEHLNLASAEDVFSAYHIEAAIAAAHATAASFESTDWKMICQMYESLARTKPGPVVQLNKAIALGQWRGANAGLDALLKITDLSNHYLYHAALGDAYAAIGNTIEARSSLEKAAVLAPSPLERELIREKIQAIA